MTAKWCDDQPIIIVNDLGNAIEMNKEYPILNVPDYRMISAIEADDLVELTHQGERFWVKVDVVTISDNHCEFIGKVTDELKYAHKFNTGDCIAFDGTNVLNIFSREWKNELRLSPNE